MNTDNMRQEKNIIKILENIGAQKNSLSTNEIDFEYQKFYKRLNNKSILSLYFNNFNYINIMNITKKMTVSSLVTVFALVTISGVYAQSSTLSLANEIKNSIAQDKILPGVSKSVKLEDLSYSKMILKAKSISKKQFLKEVDYDNFFKNQEIKSSAEILDKTLPQLLATNTVIVEASNTQKPSDLNIQITKNESNKVTSSAVVTGQVISDEGSKTVDFTAAKDINGIPVLNANESEIMKNMKIQVVKINNLERTVKFLKVKNKTSTDYIGLDADKNISFFGQIISEK